MMEARIACVFGAKDLLPNFHFPTNLHALKLKLYNAMQYIFLLHLLFGIKYYNAFITDFEVDDHQ